MEKRAGNSKPIIFLFLLFLIWILLQFLAPLALPENSVDDLSGLVANSDNEYTINNMPAPWNFVYSVGDRLCHQISERSLSINGNQMPFCTRCTAIWLGIVVGLAVMIFYTIELNEKFLIIAILSLVPIGIDGVGQLLGFWESTNIMRIITGLLVGIITGLAIGIIIDEIRTIHITKKSK